MTAAHARCHLLTRNRIRIAGAATARTPHQVDVHMIVVIGVRPRCQHCCKAIARRALHVAQKTLLLRRAVPTGLDRDLSTISKHEDSNLERVAEGMLRYARVRIAVHTAARIGGDLLDLDDGLAEPA